ncbi:hypothetical protein A3C23_04070 [Candidatus Roizmanbacteria bacterium RIFCSPHIGHO2_02_FULL_37_13b]|uniref:Uncharacterized protein n=1 Tax=Candidatus Roizmanbacteria bacterium RIFCSPLOWO2_02_FULL_36_11 TaxID=1802071 RepID=A0A1F7JH31_9BACT|nr:MAG: hypothetical protein A3C23_04070 [Candidatus Roizmanbacteria bacterium RIFCSPHIGHO2_02_FULL_37_13b]OGK54892.1 MAG: hypothetical protein A3H78_00215 [Candidatus Roizmanbacteria bacterium RIFCSPLOWO2_02_FULL_36_11]
MEVPRELNTVTHISKIMALILFILLPIISFLWGMKYQRMLNGEVSNFPVQKACTMEAKICPNGTAVGRSGPNCEFNPCPIVKTE